MNDSQRKNKIIVHLVKKTAKKPSNIKVQISQRTQKHGVNWWGAAQILANENNTSITKWIPADKKNTIGPIKIEKVIKVKKSIKSLFTPITKFDYESFFSSGKKYYLDEHMKEATKAYNATCYMSTFVILRKIFENLLIELLEKVLPPNIKENREQYYEDERGRHKDFSVVLKVLEKNKNKFGVNQNTVKKLYDLLKNFKDDANDSTHSLFHLRSKSDVDKSKITEIFNLFEILYSSFDNSGDKK